MLTFIAWTGQRGDVARRLDRVRGALELGAEYGLSSASAHGGRIGVAVWEPGGSLSRVPAWNPRAGGVTVLPRPPLPATELVGAVAPEELGRRLGAICREDPAKVVATIAPPFSLIDLDTDGGELLIVNDGIGMARLYQRRTGDLWAWSNRPAALNAFTGEAAELDRDAWSRYAVCAWFLGTTAPYLGTTRVPPSTVVRASPERVAISDTGMLSTWTAPQPGRAARAREAADGLREYVQEMERLTASTYSALLSGGRDSRVVVAATLAAELPATVVTLGPIEGEMATARRLVELLGHPIDHHVRTPEPIAGTSELYDRIRAMHAQFDGDFPAVKMQSPVGGQPTSITLGGAGGEIAHANYYPTPERLERLQRGGPRAGVERLDRYFRSLPGAAEDCYSAVSASLAASYEQSRTLGLDGPSFLDFFYLVERFRRWAPAAHSPHSYPALASPGFIRAAFDLTPAERVDARLHREIVAELVPAWSEVPFFKATAADRHFKSDRKLRLWQGEVAEEIDELLADTQAWSDVFDVDRVMELWSAAKRDGADNRTEAVFQRVLWRRVFEDHVRDLNRRIAGEGAVSAAALEAGRGAAGDGQAAGRAPDAP